MVLPLAAVSPTIDDPRRPEPPTRRRFTTAYKLKILVAAAACTTPGAIGALLRWKGLYSSHLAGWRKAGALWRLAEHERGELAEEPLRWCRDSQDPPIDGGLTVHADRVVRR